ncbi:NUDIX domain-containing protein [Sphingomonas qomolangmaensis]|uniref:NUDIX domain-containing protein n=1 Tax=Sphingomonas qomolangmaensis TaxID=2918765 RepID=A0ABY5L5C7_9SPHN|nr:NUDIX domain-containing protein [Sphingomonas qomolangmaensis]UUL81366.1 NUDIX domain-containing protein [Sphingomonas qomolangmaensis]
MASPPDNATIWPAATVVVMRDTGDAAPEILFVERAKAMTFAGGAIVFPGGRVDDADRAAALALAAADIDEAAARIAAIRETIEEAGLAIGLADPIDVESARARLYAGETMGQVIGLDRIDLDALVPFARWRPQGVSHKIFDTRFYLAQAPADAVPAVVDGNENSRLFWSSAQHVLDETAAGRMRIIFPTRRNLERLALFSSFAAAVDHARRYPVRTIVPWIECRGGIDQLCIPEDLGYPVTHEALDGALRA